MKKKLSIGELKITSFITSAESSRVKGGESELCMTQYSCQQYISCNELACTIHSNHQYCVNPLTRLIAC